MGKAHTVLESLYPEVQKRYGAARYGLRNGKPGITVMFSNGPAFVSEDDFAELMKLFPDEPVDELLFSLFADDNEDGEDEGEENVSDEESFDTDSDGDVDKKDMSNIISAINRKY